MGNCDVLLVGYEELENLGLRSIASYLLQNGVDVGIVSCHNTSKDDILRTITEKDPKIVGFSLIFQQFFHEFQNLISYLRDSGVKAHFTMGGHFPSMEYLYTLQEIPGLDSVIRGEGEVTLLELLRNIRRKKNWPHIEGLTYRKNGSIQANSPRPLIQDLDSLPFPLRKGRPPVVQRGLDLYSLISSRGCYHNCSFCSIHQFYSELPGPRRRARTPAHVVREMEELFHKEGAQVFIFEDDDMAMKSPASRRWVECFLAELRKSGLHRDILWRVSCRVDEVSEDLLAKMRDSGLMAVYLGIESGSAKGLDIYNKHYKTDRVYQAIETLERLELPYEYGFMLLNPDSTFDIVKEEIVFLKTIGASGSSVVNFTKMLPYAGTAIERRLGDEGRLQGTVIFPEYEFLDPRLELFQAFLTDAFHFRNFDNNGLVERLRNAKFDVALTSKFRGDAAEASRYDNAIRELIKKSNESCLEAMSMAVNFMSERSEKEILDNWQLLERLAMQEKESEHRITATLDQLMLSL